MPRGVVDLEGLQSPEITALKKMGPPDDLPFNINKIGHVVVMVTDIARSVDFYTRVLGFRVSDAYPDSMMSGKMVFLRCNDDHHGLALIGGAQEESKGAEFHHMAFEVDTLDELIRARDHLKKNNVPIGFEGRRRAGAQIALEFCDPDGHGLEIYWGLDQISGDDDARPPEQWVEAFSLEEAIENAPVGQDTTLKSPYGFAPSLRQAISEKTGACRHRNRNGLTMNDNVEIPNVLTPELAEALKTIATATLAHQLQNRGIRSTFLGGLRPLHPELRMVGRARTLRYVALREDLRQQYASGVNAQRRAIEATEPGDVLVIEAREVPNAATIGDIFATRLFHLGGAGIVTDGALRDTPAIADLNQPVYHLASHGATLGRKHLPFSNDEPVTCAGVFVVPGDVVVGDGEGVVVIPAALVEEVTRDALAQEEREEFALERVKAGESPQGLFPLSDARKTDFEAWQAARSKDG